MNMLRKLHWLEARLDAESGAGICNYYQCRRKCPCLCRSSRIGECLAGGLDADFDGNLHGSLMRHGAMRIGNPDSQIMDLRVDFLRQGTGDKWHDGESMKAVDISWKELFRSFKA